MSVFSEWHLVRAHEDSKKKEMEQLTFFELPWGGDIPAIDRIVTEMRNGGIKEFWIAESSTALKQQLGRFLANGCTVVGAGYEQVKDCLATYVLKLKVN